MTHAPHDPLFPPGALAPGEEECYAQTLRAMGEGALYRMPCDTYRFLWLRTRHEPVAVRLDLRSHYPTLVLTVLEKKTRSEHGSQARRETVLLEAAARAELAAQLKLVLALPLRSEREGLDGAQWVLEAWEGGRYSVLVRWSPEGAGADAAMRAFGLRLLELAGYDTSATRVY